MLMAIACAYCGGEHDRPADVRACWTENGEQDIAADGDVPPPELFVPQSDSSSSGRGGAPSGADRRHPATVRTAPAQVEIARHVAPASAGPDRLGRHALVDERTSVPESWANVERLRLGPDTLSSPAEALGMLRTAAATGTRLLIELDSEAHHLDRIAFRRDRSKQNRATVLGWTVLRYTWWDLREQPWQVISEVRTALARAL